MSEPTLVSRFARPLNQLRIPYMVTGGVASVVYGEPRITRDIALMLRVSGALVDRAELERWAIRLGVVGEWQKAQEFN